MGSGFRQIGLNNGKWGRSRDIGNWGREWKACVVELGNICYIVYKGGNGYINGWWCWELRLLKTILRAVSLWQTYMFVLVAGVGNRVSYETEYFGHGICDCFCGCYDSDNTGVCVQVENPIGSFRWRLLFRKPVF